MPSDAPRLLPESFTTFGELLRYLRRRARLTLREMAIAVDYSVGHLSRLEQGTRRPDAAAVRARFVVALAIADEPAWLQRLILLAEQGEVDAAHDVSSASQGAVSPTLPAGLSHDSADVLLATKLFMPRPRTKTVPRPQLWFRLAAAVDTPLTLVVAPPGFGKTTLLATWLASLARSEQAASHARVAWLSLDRHDSRLATFLRYLVAALQQVAPTVGVTTLRLLQAPTLLPTAALLTPLLNDLAASSGTRPGPLIVALDDYHLIADADVHAAVAFLIDYGPPLLHLLIATREDPPLPLSRLRAYGRLLELRADDLRFTPAESAALLQANTSVTLTEDELHALTSRTEGWAVGLQLAALALHDRPDRAAFLRAFTGSSRYVADYLTSEVLDRLPAHLRSFVLHTAILDRLCGSLCDAVLGLTTEHDRLQTSDDTPLVGSAHRPSSIVGRPSSTSYTQRLLEELERGNLFIVPLDDQRHWYRYHHLFGELLQAQLLGGSSRAAVAELHRRASVWYECHDLLDAAIGHALAADASLAVALVERHAARLINAGDYETVQGHIDRLPEAMVRARPQLAVARAFTGVVSGDLAQAVTLLGIAETLTARANDDVSALAVDPAPTGWLTHQQAATVVRAVATRVAGDARGARELTEEALATGPTLHPALRLWAEFERGVALSLLNELDAAQDILTALLGTIERATYPALLLATSSELGRITSMQGRLRDAARAYEQVLDQPGHAPAPSGWNTLMLQIGLAGITYEWNDLDAAMAQAEECLREATQPPRTLALALCHNLRARVALARGDETTARAALAEIDALLPALQSPFYTELLLLGGFAQMWGRVEIGDAAQFWAKVAPLAQAGEASSRADIQRLAQAHLLLRDGRPQEAATLLAPLLDPPRAVSRGVAIKALALQTSVYAALAADDAALAALEEALVLAGADGYTRTFVDEGAPLARLLKRSAERRPRGDPVRQEAERILDAFPADVRAQLASSSSALDLREALTEREQAVLRLLAQGHSNKAIAATLVIEAGTVKRHMHNILGKLGAQSRTEAVVRARSLGLIP